MCRPGQGSANHRNISAIVPLVASIWCRWGAKWENSELAKRMHQRRMG
jgi:hypothetical protein